MVIVVVQVVVAEQMPKLAVAVELDMVVLEPAVKVMQAVELRPAATVNQMLVAVAVQELLVNQEYHIPAVAVAQVCLHQ
jgi:hypothetical protein